MLLKMSAKTTIIYSQFLVCR